MKEETIEEAAEEYGYKVDELLGKQLAIECFMSGANWQKEQDSKVMYDKSEMIQLVTNAFVQMSDWKNEGKITPELEVLMKNWFETNKKK